MYTQGHSAIVIHKLRTSRVKSSTQLLAGEIVLLPTPEIVRSQEIRPVSLAFGLSGL
jgi:hypothetical protein